MRLRTLAPVLPLAGLAAARFDAVRDTANNIQVASTKRFIIEVSKVAHRQDSDLAGLTSRLISHDGTKLYKTFQSEVFTGLSVEMTKGDVETLRILEGVGRVWPSRRIQMASVIHGRTFGSGTSAANYSIHGMTGVDTLHEAGIRGKGVKVAIVDTGVDYNHPALGGGFGPEFKVIGGYDLVGDTEWPLGGANKSPDKDPFEEDSSGHGTHVSGIVAGKTDSWQGVAPEASILSYKVFGGDNGNTDEETLIEAFLRAHSDGADIITCSIGGPGGFSSNAWAEIASRLVDQGLIVTISAGNDGEEGVFFPDNGMSGKNVLAVASTEPSSVPGMPVEFTFRDGNQRNVTTWGFFHFDLQHFFPTNGSLPVKVLSTDPYNVSVGCEVVAGWQNRTDLSGALVVAPKGGCPGMFKRYSLQRAGAEHVLLFNDDQLYPMGDDWTARGVEGILGHDEGVTILQAIERGVNVSARFFNDSTTPFMNLKNPAVVASYFTSMGGLYDLQIKPDVAAPGSNIFSTMPDGQFGLKSGTSMATPYVAGIAALYIGEYGGRWQHGPGFGKMLTSRILASTEYIRWHDGVNMTDYGVPAPVFQVGNGLVNATKVLRQSTQLSWSKFALNDTANFQAHHGVNVTNNCTRPVTYNFYLEPAGGYESWGSQDPDEFNTLFRPLLPEKMMPVVTFPEGEFTLEPGETREATFHFEPPRDLNETSIPIYSGRIIIGGSNDDYLAVPYMGVGTDLRKKFKKMFADDYPRVISTRNMTLLEDKSKFSFDLSTDVQDFPRLLVRVRWGAEALRWDIFEGDWEEEDWSWPPVVGEEGFLGMAATWDYDGFIPIFDPDFDNEMDLIRGPIPELSRDVFGYPSYRAMWLGRFANGTKITVGKYTMRIATLAPFGDPNDSDDWDTYTHKFEVLPSNKTSTPFLRTAGRRWHPSKPKPAVFHPSRDH
ncbi:serine endopeptidase [Colletotrichum plurivorum]|uniref:Serine endopeptidase n=1 Tax=Colletotrichum plurivorum TaxID=2175906 RepID=A0A8H6N7G3_9PEZI|nr:serine endopeptidase [Colletotrichum plurivorum]